MEEAEAIKMHTMKLKTLEMKKKQEREAHRNMNLERMHLILRFAYQNRMIKPTGELDMK